MSKDILNRALEEVLRESYDELTGQDIPDYDFSEDFRKKMEGLVRETDGDRKKKTVRRIILAAAALSAAAVICAVAALNGGKGSDRHGGYHGESITAEVTSAAVSVTSVSSGAAVSGTAVTESTAAVTTAKPAGTSAKTSLTSQGRKETHTTITVGGSQQTVTTDTHIRRGGFDMKKLGPIAASMIMLASMSAEYVRASFENIPKSMISPEQYTLLEEMNRGHIETDINMDGVFDLKDCFDMIGYEYGYETDEAVAERIRQNYDLNGDGCVYSPEPENLLVYYILYKGVDLEDLEPSSYSRWDKTASDEQADNMFWLDPNFPKRRDDPIYNPEYDNLDHYNFYERPSYDPDRFEEYRAELKSYMKGKKLSEIFTGKLRGEVWLYKAGYSVFRELADNGGIDIDTDKNGIISIKDYVQIYDNGFDTVKGLDDAAYYVGDYATQYLLWYCIEKSELLTDTAETEFYKEYISGENRSKVGILIKDTYDRLYPAEEALRYSAPVMELEFYEYYDKLENGTVKLPDTNGDGVLDIWDNYNAEIFINGRRRGATMATSILPDDIWKKFMNGFDLNGNGISGDIHDIGIYEMSLAYFATDPEHYDYTLHNNTLRYYEYKERLMKEKGLKSEDPANVQNHSPKDIIPEISCGDVNGDGCINAVDASAVLAYYTRISTDQAGGFSDNQITAADVDGNGSVNAVDASKIMAYYAYTSTSGSMSIEEFLRQ